MRLINEMFSWVIYSTVLSSVMVLLILGIKHGFKQRISPTWHYYIWVVLLIRLLIPYSPRSSFSLWNLFNNNLHHGAVIHNINNGTEAGRVNGINRLLPTDSKAEQVSLKVQETVNSPEAVITAHIDHVNAPIKKDQPTKNLLSIFWLIAKGIWISGVGILTILLLLVYLKFRNKFQKSMLVNQPEIIRILDSMKHVAGIKREISIVESGLVAVPSLYGILHPVIILPSDRLDDLSRENLEHIFLHELSHLKRMDPVMNWIILAAGTLNWFNPVIIYGLKTMRQDAEVSCDALVLSLVGNEACTAYGRTIVSLAGCANKHKWVPGVSAIISNKNKIRRRIELISIYKKASRRTFLLGAGLFVALSALLLTNPKISLAKGSGSQKTEGNVAAGVDKKPESNVEIKEVKGKIFNGKMMIVKDPKSIIAVSGYMHSKIDSTLKDMIEKNHGVGGINGGGYQYINIKHKPTKPAGVIIHESKILFNENKKSGIKQDIAGFSSNGTLIVGKFTLGEVKKLNIKEAVSFGPALVLNGKPMITKGMGGWGVAPRTVIGQRADGTVLMLAINGRRKSSIGASLKDVMDLMLDNGAVTAVNLDGGSSTTMFFEDKLINSPCDINGKYNIPKIPSAFVVTKP